MPESLVFWWFKCPAGHLGLIDAEQVEGIISIVCDQCDFHGLVEEGELGEKHIIKDEFPYLKG